MNEFEKRVAQQRLNQEQVAEEIRIQRIGSHIVKGQEVSGDCNMDRHEDLVRMALWGFDMSDHEDNGLVVFVSTDQQSFPRFDPTFYQFTDYRDEASWNINPS